MTRVTLLSLEPWDKVWRRNQHLAAELVNQGLVDELTFVEPPSPRPSEAEVSDLPIGIRIERPVLRFPKRLGGLQDVGRTLRRDLLNDNDFLWINDPATGLHCMTLGQSAIYDVTDDWRVYDFPERILRRLVAAEDRLARTATTVVCSQILRDRWIERYGVTPNIVHNGIDVDAWHSVSPRELPCAAPHVGYIGTIQPQRLDIDLVIAIARSPDVGTMHLVGPDALDDESRRRLQHETKIVMHGAVPAEEVPAWTAAMNVLVCPHRITPFTLSLDAIKAREYLISGVPIVATPTSGFQYLDARKYHSVNICGASDFVTAVNRACVLKTGRSNRDLPDMGWAQRAREFFANFRLAQGNRPLRIDLLATNQESHLNA